MHIGDRLPEFVLMDQHGDEFNSLNMLGNPFILFFYPKDFTPGCVREVCSFRDYFEEFSDMGVSVIGISGDDEKTHRKFATRYKLPFTLLADTSNKVRRLFDVKKRLGILPGRETFVFNTEGELTFKIRALGADPHITKALQHLKKP